MKILDSYCFILLDQSDEFMLFKLLGRKSLIHPCSGATTYFVYVHVPVPVPVPVPVSVSVSVRYLK